jgi:[acyl-carrier-protein] S-malonyltransferase
VNTGIIFPGMGPSGYADLGKFIAVNPYARRLRRTADEVLGYSLMDRYRESGTDYSEYSQVAFLLSCLALIEQGGDELDGEPVACAGPSFGGKAALAYAGALSCAQTLLLTARLARCEEEYFSSAHRDVITQSVARTPENVLQEILGAMTERREWHDISAQIDQDFFMVSMRAASLERFTKDVRAAGGLPLYAMRPPMHSAAFGPLRRKVEDEVLGEFSLGDPRLPVVGDHDGAVLVTAADLRVMLLDGIVRPVRWPRVVRSLTDLGITRVYIAGPDSLFGRVPCTRQAFEVISLNPGAARRADQDSMAQDSMAQDSMAQDSIA